MSELEEVKAKIAEIGRGEREARELTGLFKKRTELLQQDIESDLARGVQLQTENTQLRAQLEKAQADQLKLKTIRDGMIEFGKAEDRDRFLGALARKVLTIVLCDGCNVRGGWEHRCHGEPITVRGEMVYAACECAECNGGD